jgi:hypothetical protein
LLYGSRGSPRARRRFLLVAEQIYCSNTGDRLLEALEITRMRRSHDVPVWNQGMG